MKKFLIVITLIFVIAGGAFAQDPTDIGYDTMRGQLEGFASGVANALPMASTIGLQWSKAYLGQLPHFGVGIAVGFASIPFSSMDALFEAFGIPDFLGEFTDTLPSEFSGLIGMLGFPFPAVVADARIGGIILPFDIGIKAGYIPPELYGILDDATGGFISPDTLDYALFGFDIRYALLKEPKGFSLIPDLIIGGGYNYYRGKIALPMPGMDFAIEDIPIPIAAEVSSLSYDPKNTATYYNYSLSMTDPAVGFSWQSHVIDLKAQISKKILLIITPYAGIGASYGRSRADAGMFVEPTVTKNGAPSSLEEMEKDLAAAEEALDELTGKDKTGLIGEGEYDFSDIAIPTGEDAGFVVSSWVNGWGFRAYGGLSINLFFIKLDASVMYDIIGQSLGAQVGLRIQF
jgi:hypothetical protein